MGPEIIVTALALYAVAFAVVGGVAGALIDSHRAFLAIVGVLAIAVGMTNAAFAPSGYDVEAGLIGFFFASIIMGSIGALVRALRRSAVILEETAPPSNASRHGGPPPG